MMIKLLEDINVSFSRIRLWRRCHRAHHYRYYQKLRKIKPPAPLIRGTIVHELLDANSNGKKLSDVVKKYSASHGKLFAEEREIYGDMLFDCVEIVSGYKKYWGNDGMERLEFNGSRAEHMVDLELSSSIRFRGKIDEIDRDQKKRVFYCDHKTAKKIPDEDARFNDYQILLYGWAGPQMGMPKPDGVLWDYLRTKLPTIPQELKAGGLSKRKDVDTTYDVYMAEIERLGLNPVDYTEILDIVKNGVDNFYKRIFLPFSSKRMVEEVVSEIKFVSKEIQSRGAASTDRSMDRTCKQCQYYMICSAELRGLDADFVREQEYFIEKKRTEDADPEEELDD